jgi:hypothetical protein
MGNPPAAAGTQTTRLDPAIRSRARVLVSTLPFAIIASIGVSLMVTGPGWGLLPLLAVGVPAPATDGGAGSSSLGQASGRADARTA